MKKFIKIAAVVTVVCMLGTLLAGCGNEFNEHGRLRVFFQDQRGTDTQLVSDTLDKMVQEKIGVSVEIVQFGPTEFSTKLPMMLASDEQMDIGWDSGATFVTRARQGAYYDISEILPKYAPDLYNLYPDTKFWEGVTIDGGLYGVPTLKEMGEQWAVYTDEESMNDAIAAGFEYDIDRVYELKELEPVLKAQMDNGRRGYCAGTSIQTENLFKNYYFDTVVDNFVINKKDGKTIQHLYFTPEYEEYVKLMKEWYNKGYIAEDVHLGSGAWYGRGAGMAFVGYAPGNEDIQTYYAKETRIPIMVSPVEITNTSVRGSIFAVYAKTINAKDDLLFMQLWNTDPEVKNLITYGIEGKHYTLNEEGKVVQDENYLSMYLNQNWATGNNLISYLLATEKDDKYEKFEKWNTQADFSVCFGFTPDTSEVEGYILSVNSICNTYAGLLGSGYPEIDDPEYGLAAIQKKLKDAHVDQVIENLQIQFDAWLESK